MKVKSPAESAAKWSERAGSSTSDYINGVQNPKNDWKQATVAAAETWKQGTTKAMNEGRFAKGVNRVGSQKQIENSVSKGSRRFGEGVAIAQNDYADAVAPYLDVIERTQLPQRGPKGDPKNIDRVGKIAAALHAAKLAGR